MRAAVYLRVSSDRQDVRNSVARQLAACRTWAAANGATILEDHVYRDEAVSGSSLSRPGLQRILKPLKARGSIPFDALLVDDSSRLDRGGNLAELVRVFAARGVQLIAVDSGRDLTDEDEELLVHVKAGLDSHALREIARRTRAGLAQRAARGMWTGGRVYGYRLVKGENGTAIEVDKIQAKVVREIFRRYAEGAGLREIASLLNSRGVPSPRAGTWDVTGVRSLLRNRKYIGDFTWNIRRWKKRPESLLTEDERAKVALTGRHPRIPQIRPLSERVAMPREDLRIIDDATWEIVAAKFIDRAGVRGKRPTSSPLSGLLKCACGGPIVRHGGGRGRPRLACAWAARRGAAVCTNRTALAEADVLRAVLEHLELLTPGKVRISARDVTRRIAVRGRRAPDDGAKLAKRLAAVELEVVRLTDAIAAGADVASVREALATRRALLEQLRRDLAASRLTSVPTQLRPVTDAEVGEALKQLSADLATTGARLAPAIRRLVAGIVATPADRTWRLRVTTRPWVLGLSPKIGSGGVLSTIGDASGIALVARWAPRGRVRA